MSTWYDSTGQTPNSNGGFGPPCGAAQSFTTPAGGSLTLNQLQVVCISPGAGPSSFSIEIDLYADSGGSVGAKLATLAASASTGTITNLTWTTVDFSSQITPATVAGGTRYWIGLISISQAEYGENNGNADGERNQGIPVGGACDFIPGSQSNSLGAQFFMLVGGVSASVPVPVGKSLASVPTADFPGQVAAACPVLAADLHGLVAVYQTLNPQGSPAVSYPVLNLALTNDLATFATWLLESLWDWSADSGLPTDLVASSGINGVWLTWDALAICCGRAYLAVQAKALTGSPPAASPFQQLHVGELSWNSILVP